MARDDNDDFEMRRARAGKLQNKYFAQRARTQRKKLKNEFLEACEKSQALKRRKACELKLEAEISVLRRLVLALARDVKSLRAREQKS